MEHFRTFQMRSTLPSGSLCFVQTVFGAVLLPHTLSPADSRAELARVGGCAGITALDWMDYKIHGPIVHLFVLYGCLRKQG